MRVFLALLLIALPIVSVAEILVPVRTIRAKEIIGAEDVVFKQADMAGALDNPADVVGKEARVALYAGRPLHRGDVGPPAIVARNAIVALIYNRGGLSIATEGRSLGRGAAGDVIRAMNIASRTTITGTILPDGSIKVH